jgi:hypothetical protein
VNAAFGSPQHHNPIITAVLSKARQKYHFPWYIGFKERHVIKRPSDRKAYPGPVKSLTPIDIVADNSFNTNKDGGIDDCNKKDEGRVNSIIGLMADLSSTTVWQWKQVLDNATYNLEH